MAEEVTQTDPWVRIEELIRAGDAAALQAFIEQLPAADVTRAVARLDDTNQADLLTILHPEAAADLLEDLSDAQGADIIEELPAEHAAAIVEELDSDHRADILGELHTQDAHAILEQMAPDEAADARLLMRYDAHTAGGLMITEYLLYPSSLTVGNVLDDMREHADAYSDYSVQYAYVKNERGCLVGVLPLRDLVLSRASRPIQEVMIPSPISVVVDTDLERLEAMFDQYQFAAFPVIDREGAMVGVVQRSDAEEAVTDRAERVFMRWSGIFGADEHRNLPLFNRSVGRLWWLTINLILSFVSASIILMFQPTLEGLVILAAVLPVLANVSGCSGNQAVAVSIREMTLGIINPRDLVRVISKEVSVGLVNGSVLGVLLGGAVFLWQRDLRLAGVVAIAMALNIPVSVILGGCTPLAMRRLGIDPAVASPILTTFVDMCGFLAVLGLATLFLM